jgi:hypothetical protein
MCLRINTTRHLSHIHKNIHTYSYIYIYIYIYIYKSDFILQSMSSFTGRVAPAAKPESDIYTYSQTYIVIYMYTHKRT